MESGSFAAFEVPMVFANNSVSAGYAGGAVYASGQVRGHTPHAILYKCYPFWFDW